MTQLLPGRTPFNREKPGVFWEAALPVQSPVAEFGVPIEGALFDIYGNSFKKSDEILERAFLRCYVQR